MSLGAVFPGGGFDVSIPLRMSKWEEYQTWP